MRTIKTGAEEGGREDGVNEREKYEKNEKKEIKEIKKKSRSSPRVGVGCLGVDKTGRKMDVKTRRGKRYSSNPKPRPPASRFLRTFIRAPWVATH